MRLSLTPARRRGVEILDDPLTPPDVRARAMRDVARANVLFGGIRSVLRALEPVLSQLPARAILIDVGTGMADIPSRVRSQAADAGLAIQTFGVDFSESLVRRARARVNGAAVASALQLPFPDDSADIVICSQLLHHFDERDIAILIAELHRVSRRWVVVSDLRRSWLAAGGFWLASLALRFHPVTRHDGVISVLRGFTEAELTSLVSTSVGNTPRVHRSVFWRLHATWRKQSH